MNGVVLLDERTRSIVWQQSRGLAIAQVDAELRHELWPVPADKAARLGLYEARLTVVTQQTYDAAMAFYGQSSAAPVQVPTPSSNDTPPGFDGGSELEDDVAPDGDPFA